MQVKNPKDKPFITSGIKVSLKTKYRLFDTRKAMVSSNLGSVVSFMPSFTVAPKMVLVTLNFPYFNITVHTMILEI